MTEHKRTNLSVDSSDNFFLDLFCRVIDNFGDAGFSLRLSRSLYRQGIKVRLFCDHQATLEPLLTQDDRDSALFSVELWPDPADYCPAPAVVAAFSCRLEAVLEQRLKSANCLLINLEYLTAEDFAASCHGLSSPTGGLKCYFFFPGFSPQTGGLLKDDRLFNLRKNIVKIYIKDRSENSLEGCLDNHQKTVPVSFTDINTQPLTVSFFSYHNERALDFIDHLRECCTKLELKVCAGMARECLQQRLKTGLNEGDELDNAGMKVQCLPMLSQDEYDLLLSCCNLNLVRGEESVVRAMLLGRPFLWDIYVQKDQAHVTKLKALFTRIDQECCSGSGDLKLSEGLHLWRELNLEYIGSKEIRLINTLDLRTFWPTWCELSWRWSEYLWTLPNLGDSLRDFIQIKLQNRLPT